MKDSWILSLAKNFADLCGKAIRKYAIIFFFVPDSALTNTKSNNFFYRRIQIV